MNLKNHKFLQVGLGSMGKRRIRNLLFNGIKAEQIFGFDISADHCHEAEQRYGIKTFSDFKDAVRIKPDAMIISTVPNAHHRYFLYAAKHKINFFVEATTVEKGYDKLFSLLDDSFVAAPSCTFRYFPAIKIIKKIVRSGRIGKILSFTYHLGQYLPDWHPWEDYRRIYFAQKETGGCREMFVFELIWLLDLLGSKVKKVKGFVKKISDLEMPADDVYSANLLFENNVVGNMMIDVISRWPFRTLRLIGTEGILEWEWLAYQLKIFNVKNKKWKTLKIKKGRKEKGYVATEDMYQEEMDHFLKALKREKKYPYSFREDQTILKTLVKLEKNSHEN